MSRLIVRALNWLTRLRRPRCKPEELLLLLPACLQNSACTRKVTRDVDECARCGRCKIKDLLDIRDRYGIRCAVATGGRIALDLASRPDVRAVVAVACELELRQGLMHVFPKPALGIVNIRPHGPCTDTDVDIREVENAVRAFLGLDPLGQDTAPPAEPAG